MSLYDLEGWLSNAEGDRLSQLAAEVVAPYVIVELGSYRGKSSCFLAQGSRAGNRRPVHCVDLWALGGQWESDVARRDGPPLHQDDPAHYEAFKRNTEPFKGSIVEVHGRSVDVGRTWRGLSVGLLFVDADHTYAGVLGDLVAWFPHMAPGGVIACHDYTNTDYPGVGDACDEFFGALQVSEMSVVDSMLVVRL